VAVGRDGFGGWPQGGYLSDTSAVLRDVLRMGYRFRMLGDPESPDLLWVDVKGESKPGMVSTRLPVGEMKRVKAAGQSPASGGSDMFDPTLKRDGRCFVLHLTAASGAVAAELPNCPRMANLGKNGGPMLLRERRVWQVLPDTNTVRILRSDDGGEIDTVRFEPAAGAAGSLVAAVDFNRNWMAEWRSGSRRWLVLHSPTGKPLTAAMASPVEGELFDSSNLQGLEFLKWEGGKPVEWITVPASVEWSVASD
jgi:hypothetical protein